MSRLPRILTKNSSSLFLCTLIISIIVSRYLSSSHYLYEWDSVQYALSIFDFNILWHLPHPPGYILYVYLIKLAHFFITDPNRAIIITNIIISLIAILFFYRLSTSFFQDTMLAQIATVTFSFNPVFFFYGTNATIYVIDSLTSIVIGYVFWLVLKSKNRKLLLVGSLLLGVMGGFRQTSIILFGPLWLFALFFGDRSIKGVIKNSVVLVLSILIWFIPVITNTDGLMNFLLSSQGLSGSGTEKVVTFFGSFRNYLITNWSNYFVWLMQGLTPHGLLIILIALWMNLRKKPLKLVFSNRKAAFLLVWVIPSFLLYAIYIEKAGYILTLLPAMYLLLTWAVSRIIRFIRGVVKKSWLIVYTCITTLIMVAWFIFPAKDSGIPTKIHTPSYIMTPPMSDYNWDISNRETTLKDHTQEQLYSLISKHVGIRKDAEIFWVGGYPTWRHLSYYYPELDSYWLVDAEISGKPGFGSEFYVSQNFITTSYSGLPFWFDSIRPDSITINLKRSTETVIFIGNPNMNIMDKLIAKVKEPSLYYLDNGQKVVFFKKPGHEMDLGTFILKSE